jgi:hypothetical protein
MMTNSLFDDLASKSQIETYLTLTKHTLPYMAQDPHRRWPVKHDHCFQRIVLDAVCQGVWHQHINKPAYLHLTQDQTDDAVALCHQIISGQANIHILNTQSLRWRGKLNDGSQ